MLAVYYNPPDNDCSEILQNHLENTVRYESTFFIGDFNTDPFKQTRRSSRFMDTVSSMSYNCINSEPTFFYQNGSSVLDLLLTDSPNLVLKFNQVSMPGVSNHDMIFSTIDF